MTAEKGVRFLMWCGHLGVLALALVLLIASLNTPRAYGAEFTIDASWGEGKLKVLLGSDYFRASFERIYARALGSNAASEFRQNLGDLQWLVRLYDEYDQRSKFFVSAEHSAWQLRTRVAKDEGINIQSFINTLQGRMDLATDPAEYFKNYTLHYSKERCIEQLVCIEPGFFAKQVKIFASKDEEVRKQVAHVLGILDGTVPDERSL